MRHRTTTDWLGYERACWEHRDTLDPITRRLGGPIPRAAVRALVHYLRDMRERAATEKRIHARLERDAFEAEEIARLHAIVRATRPHTPEREQARRAWARLYMRRYGRERARKMARAALRRAA